MIVTGVDRAALEAKVKSMYSEVAANPHGECHFEMGRATVERLGYSPADLDRIPAHAIEPAQKATARWGVKSVSILARKR
jgi:hypothetical protein